MKLKACAVFLLASMALSAQALAFNGKRKGFILGGGFGSAYLMYKGEFYERNEFSLAANIKIGYAPSESFEIYLLNSALESQDEGVIGVEGIGVTKYLNRAGKGLFLFGGVGGAFRYDEWGYPLVGVGVLGGVGYDIGKHWSIQGDVLYTNLESGTASIVSFRASINFLAF